MGSRQKSPLCATTTTSKIRNESAPPTATMATSDADSLINDTFTSLGGDPDNPLLLPTTLQTNAGFDLHLGPLHQQHETRLRNGVFYATAVTTTPVTTSSSTAADSDGQHHDGHISNQVLPMPLSHSQQQQVHQAHLQQHHYVHQQPYQQYRQQHLHHHHHHLHNSHHQIVMQHPQHANATGTHANLADTGVVISDLRHESLNHILRQSIEIDHKTLAAGGAIQAGKFRDNHHQRHVILDDVDDEDDDEINEDEDNRDDNDDVKDRPINNNNNNNDTANAEHNECVRNQEDHSNNADGKTATRPTHNDEVVSTATFAVSEKKRTLVLTHISIIIMLYAHVRTRACCRLCRIPNNNEFICATHMRVYWRTFHAYIRIMLWWRCTGIFSHTHTTTICEREKNVAGASFNCHKIQQRHVPNI